MDEKSVRRNNHEIRIRNAKSGKLSGGKTQYLRYLNGETITRMQAMLSKCFECCGYYADGRRDCLMSDCALYPWMPYKGEEERVEDVPDEP